MNAKGKLTEHRVVNGFEGTWTDSNNFYEYF